MAKSTKDKTYILCFGNSYIEEDALAKRIADSMQLEGFVLIKCNSPEEIMFYADKKIVLLDVARNVLRPMIINDLKMLKEPNLVSLHDFDLSYFLKLIEKMHNIKNIPIIAIPKDGNKEQIIQEIAALLKSLFPDNFKEVC